MIPSDHFVRFYNEVFKKLAALDGLADYYQEISRHQEQHCLKDFRAKGFRGVCEYFQKIAREEHCDIEKVIEPHCIYSVMRHCPSLTKVLDNDAEAFYGYCDHCAGWVHPLFRKAGLFCIRDHVDNTLPTCRSWLFDNLVDAEKKLAELETSGLKPPMLSNNFR